MSEKSTIEAFRAASPENRRLLDEAEAELARDEEALLDTLVDLALECDEDDLIAALGQEEFDRRAASGRAIVGRGQRGGGVEDGAG